MHTISKTDQKINTTGSTQEHKGKKDIQNPTAQGPGRVSTSVSGCEVGDTHLMCEVDEMSTLIRTPQTNPKSEEELKSYMNHMELLARTQLQLGKAGINSQLRNV